MRSTLSVGIALLLFGTPASAADYFVDAANGDDSNAGTSGEPFASVQRGIDQAMPGDTVVVADGDYAEAPDTMRDGTELEPITVRAENSRGAVITAPGNVLRVRHSHHVFEGLVIDGQLGDGRTVRLRDSSDHVVLRDLEVRNSGNNCIDIAASDDVLIEDCSIHHCLLWQGGEVQDAHGITGDAPTNITVRDSEIYYFSGDAIQLSPPREFWDNLLVERTTMWIGPLPVTVGNFQAGEIYGENAFDSKTPESGARPRAVFRDVVAYGFKGFITNQGAFNVKENVDFTLDRATIYDSELAFRMRGPALAVVRNAVVYGNDAAVRYEDAIEDLTFQNVTFADPLVDGGGGAPVNMAFQNALFVADVVPSEATGASNVAAASSFFVDRVGKDFHLLPDAPAVDAGDSIAEVTEDRDGVMRPVGDAYDVGAYEWTDASPASGSGGSGASGSEVGGAGVGGLGSSEGGSSHSNANGGAGAEPSSEDGGCGCRTVGAPTSRTPWLALVWALALRRRRRASAQAIVSHDEDHMHVDGSSAD